MYKKCRDVRDSLKTIFKLIYISDWYGRGATDQNCKNFHLKYIILKKFRLYVKPQFLFTFFIFKLPNF